MKKLILFSITFLHLLNCNSQSYYLNSPDNRIQAHIKIDRHFTFSIVVNGNNVIYSSSIDISVTSSETTGDTLKVDSITNAYHNNNIIATVSPKDKVIKDEYNEITINTNKNYSLNFRAYNDGFAYRFLTFFEDSISVTEEQLNLNFPENTSALLPLEKSIVSHYERMYIPTKPDTLTKDQFCSLPVYLNVSGKSIVITESDLYDYPGMFLQGTSTFGLQAKFPHLVKETMSRKGSDRNQELVYSPTSIAYTEGTRAFPWRVFIIADNDAELVESNLVFQLARPLEIEDPSWIVPGKVAWDWYNANNIYDVDFESGINTSTYKRYIDFASEYGLEYIILDEGWSRSTTDISGPNSNIDLKELIDYGRKKNVGLILWVLWEPLDKNMKVLETYNNWGIKGIKVDFMQRTDQYMVNYYERVAKEAAKYKLLVDFHGSYKPSGLRRAYPNVLTYEGLKGNENNKWSSLITPKHNVTLPFVRMIAGPMDYTPGAMNNSNESNHSISWTRPVSIGTRCHQAAMYVVYESPLQMFCDSPSSYIRDSNYTAFIAKIPSVWDETIVLEGEVGEYIVVARRKDKEWYIGAMTDMERTITLDLSFIQKETAAVSILKDGINAARFAEDYTIEHQWITKGDRIKISIAKGGGFVAIVH